MKGTHTQRRSAFCNGHGFTLLEILVTLAVLAFGVLGYMALQFYSISSRVYSKNVGGAIAAGATEVEHKLAQDFDAPSLLAGTTKPPQYIPKRSAGGANESSYESGSAYKVEWAVGDWITVSGNPNAYLRQLKTVHALTKWKERGMEYSSKLATFKRNCATGDRE
jgi:prepilin-type N-terminal cleavage/methylation domain-containing protein